MLAGFLSNSRAITSPERLAQMWSSLFPVKC